jgi:uncharacterized protein
MPAWTTGIYYRGRMTVFVEGVPDLLWSHGEGKAAFDEASHGLALTAAAGVDWSNDSLDGPQQHSATSLGFLAPDEFTLSARVAVKANRTTFDAAVLAVWGDQDHWAKLCFEFSPQREAMVVSVVTNGYSDDCNSAIVAHPSIYLRVVRTGPAWAFHASDDGAMWRFVRLFRLEFAGPIRVGFMSQAPTGDSCVAIFDEIAYDTTVPGALRDGS